MKPPFASHREVWEWMEGFTNLERVVGSHREYRLDRMRCLAAYLGNPQDSLKAIHIAGSKGKGSLAFCLAKTLGSAGLRTGLFMSPHVFDWRERLLASDGFFGEDSYLSAGNELRQLVDSLASRPDFEFGNPTTFELLTLLAFVIFKKEGLSYVVLETGLGGRLDATNICNPKICILTHLELEHTDVLGPTIEHIAYEKAMIAKPSTPLVTLCPEGPALNKIRSTVFSQGAWLVHHQGLRLGPEEQRLRLAELCFEYLAANDPEIKPLDLTRISPDLPLGRQTLLRSSQPDLPSIFADGAHTPDSIAFALRAMPHRAVLVFALASGKRDSEIMGLIKDQFDEIIITRPGTYKQSDSLALFELARSMAPGAHLSHCNTETEALERALALTKPISVLGSFHLLGALWPLLMDKGYEVCR